MAREAINPDEFVQIQTNALCVEVGPTPSMVVDFAVKSISGISVTGEGIIATDFSESLNNETAFSSMVFSVGEWCAVAERSDGDDKEFIILGDSYGYCPIFYSMVPGENIIVSTSYNAVAAGLRKNGVAPRLNTSHYLAILTTSSSLFQGPLHGETMGYGIGILPVGKALHVTNNHAFLIDRSYLEFGLEKVSPAQALAKGVEEVVGMTRHLAEIEGIERVLHLSGGVDSRLLLAILRASGTHKDFSIYTGDPRGASGYSRAVFERDADIAATLVEDLGLEWCSPSEKKLFPISFLTSLKIHQSFNSNYAFDRGLPSTLDTATRPRVSLLGGGGEILRSPSGPLVIADNLTKAGVDLSLNVGGGIGSWIIRNQPVLEEYKERVSSVFDAALGDTEGTTTQERLVNQYFIGRNRTHFGQTRSSAVKHYVPIHLLSNPFFLHASKSIPFQERVTGRLVKDLFAITDSELLSYPFESDVATERYSSTRLREIRGAEGWISVLDASRQKNVSNDISHFSRGLKSPSRFVQKSSTQVFINYLRLGFAIIEDFLEEENTELLRRQHLRILNGVERGNIKASMVVAKVASALDTFISPSERGVAVKFYTNLSSRKALLEQISITKNLPHTLNTLAVGEEAVVEMRPIISRTETGLRANANPLHTPDARFEYAFYLMSEGKRANQRWYTEDPQTVFEVAGPGQFSIIAFARRRDFPSVVYQARSEYITLE